MADLKRATGELDGHSVLIATNGKELAALQALGERNYVQFTIQKSKQSQKVGDVSIRLEKADPKKNRFTIELTADDKTIEKKDRGHQRAAAVHDVESQAALRAGGERREEGHHRRLFVDSEGAEHQELTGNFERGFRPASSAHAGGRVRSARRPARQLYPEQANKPPT